MILTRPLLRCKMRLLAMTTIIHLINSIKKPNIDLPQSSEDDYLLNLVKNYIIQNIYKRSNNKQFELNLIQQQFELNLIQQMRIFKNLRFFGAKKKVDKPKSIALTPQQLQSLNKFKSQIIPLGCQKVLPQANKKNTLITSALPYVNNVPHLGNIIGALLSADVIARYRRLKGQNVLFICGTDQYGTATEIKAKQMKKSPQQICDEYHQLHKQIYQWFNISYNHFGRTSHPDHQEVVQNVFRQCFQNNLFKEKSIKQLYCDTCAMFLADRFVVGQCKTCKAVTKADQCDSCNKLFQNPQLELDNIKCTICNSSPQVKNTTHLFLNYEQNPELIKKLQGWLGQNNRIQSWSNNAKGETRYYLKGNLKDRCITRDLKWGVPVPLVKYQNKVFYVWFDAPIGYISITKQLLGMDYLKWWVKDQKFKVQLMQFMGKDNIMFHSLLFPSTLLSTKNHYNLVDKLCVTEYLRYQGGKFSKSNNRGVFGNDCVKTNIQSDVWRFYLLSNRPENFDTQFSWTQFAEVNNKQLMNSIGNLYSRVLKAAYKQFSLTKQIPKLQQLQEVQNKLVQQLKYKFIKYIKALENNQIKSCCKILLDMSYDLNKYVQWTEFWKNKQRKNIIIGFLLRELCILGHVMQPLMPISSAKIYYLLGIDHQYKQAPFKQLQQNFKSYFTSCLQRSTGLKQPHLLFTQIKQEDVKEFGQKYGRVQTKIQKTIKQQ